MPPIQFHHPRDLQPAYLTPTFSHSDTGPLYSPSCAPASSPEWMEGRKGGKEGK